jgi:hypothetical protein
MENAFDRAYDAYIQRKQEAREVRWQQLRADLACPIPAAGRPSNKSKHAHAARAER